MRQNVFFSLLLAATLSPGVAYAGSLYVAPTGSNTNLGTLRKPFRTLQKAADSARAGDTVFVRTGTYRETVRPARSGTAGSPIVFRPYGKEKATVSGAALIQSRWTAAGEGLYFTDWPGEYVSANNQSDAVFVDGRMVNLARWPEETNHDLSRPHEGRIVSNVRTVKTDLKAPGPQYDLYDTTFFDPTFDEPDGRWRNAKVWVCNGGATDTQDGDGVTGIVLETDRAAHTVTIRAPVSGPIGKATLDYSKDYQIGTGSHYYLFDPPTRAGLLFGGEFWHDRVGRRLYLRTSDGSDPATHRVEVKQRDYGFLLDPDGKGRSYLTVRGFGLFACSVTTDRDLGNGLGNGGNRGGVGPSRYILLEGLNAEYVTHFTDQGGNVQTQWGQSSGIIVSGEDCEIRNSVIAWSSGSGIVVTGRRCKAINNLVHDVVYAATDCGGISVGAQYNGSDSLDTEVGYNTVYNVGIDGIEITSLKNSDPNHPGVARVHHNIIHDAVLQVADSAAIHEFGHDGQWARVDHNLIHDIGGIPNGYLYSGIYLDYAPDGGNSPGRYIFDHNVIYNVSLPIEINHPNSLLVANNTLLDSGKRGPIQSNGGAFTNVILRNNLANDPFAGVPTSATQDHNITDATDALFTDAAHHDYMLSGTARAAVGAGAANITEITKTPDIGAYASGKPRFRVGYDPAHSPAPDAPLPALLPAVRTGGNVFLQGDFEASDPGGAALGWTWIPFGNVSVAQESDGNHYLRITHEQKDRTLQAFARLPLDASWKALTVSCRMKVSGLQVGPLPNLTAALVLRSMDKDDKLLKYAPSLSLSHDTGWTELHETFALPPGADHLNIEASNIGAAGDMGADDIVFRPNP